MKILPQMREYLAGKQWGRFALCCAAIALAASLLIWLAYIVIMFLAARFEIILTIVGGYCLLWYFIYTRRQEKKKREKETEIEKTEAEKAREQMKQERDYNDIGSWLFSALENVCEMLGFQKPDRPRRLHSPGKTIDCGTFVKYRYQLLKKSDTINAATVCAVLQQEIDQRIQTGEFGLPTKKHSYKGHFYSALQVLDVQDVGNYCHIDIAIAGDNVCSYIDSRDYITFEQNNNVFTDTKDGRF